MRLTASRPFLPCATRLISGKALRRKASSSRAGFSSSTMRVLMDMGGQTHYRRVGKARKGTEGLPLCSVATPGCARVVHTAIKPAQARVPTLPDCHRGTEVTERKNESEDRPTQTQRGKARKGTDGLPLCSVATLVYTERGLRPLWSTPRSVLRRPLLDKQECLRYRIATEGTEKENELRRPTQPQRGKIAEFDYTAERRVLPRSVHGEEECRKETGDRASVEQRDALSRAGFWIAAG